MKTLFIEARSKQEFKIDKSEIRKLPRKLLLLYSIQYKKQAREIKRELEKGRIKIVRFQQVLGCSKINNKQKLPVLLIGSGEFHALNLYLQAPATYIIIGGRVKQVPRADIERLRAYRKSALIKFLKADNLGILVSTKPGQQNLKSAIKLKERLEKEGKQAFILITNNIEPTQFENFNIDSWINTACPGLAYDNPSIINIDEIQNK
jgi:2-(3-amino-3-carboxypropyl)histidine synthase